MTSRGDSREKILHTASRLFQLQGYHATGLNQIVKESGAPKGFPVYVTASIANSSLPFGKK